MRQRVDVVVVGGGQAGLGTAYFLATMGLDAVVLERGQVGETWLAQRWDSFALNTPNWMNGLPGDPYAGDSPDGFMTHHELAASFQNYVNKFELEVRPGTHVTEVRRSSDGSGFTVDASSADEGDTSIQCDAVVIASGILNAPRIPDVGQALPPHILQLSTGTYRSAETLPEGAVLVVGGGQSGAQIVEDLIGAGRHVFFSISNVARVPRRYRGRDFMDWWVDMGIWDVDIDDVHDPAVLSVTNPLVSGLGPVGHTISYQDLARRGVTLLGRLAAYEGGKLKTDDKVAQYAQHADEFSLELKQGIDDYIAESGLIAPEAEAELDPADDSVDPNHPLDFQTELDIYDAGVSTVIWSTGFTSDFSWIDLPVADERGKPIHHKGVSPIDGLYFVGFPWLSKRKSGVIYGIEEDAKHVAEDILRRIGPST